MFKKSFSVFLLPITFANAGNSLTSEFSHFAGGLLMVWLIAYIVFKYFSKYKESSVLIGFLISLFYVSIDQSIDYVKDGKLFNQLLDFGSHMLGSILAALIAKYKMKKDHS